MHGRIGEKKLFQSLLSGRSLPGYRKVIVFHHLFLSTIFI